MSDFYNAFIKDILSNLYGVSKIQSPISVKVRAASSLSTSMIAASLSLASCELAFLAASISACSLKTIILSFLPWLMSSVATSTFDSAYCLRSSFAILLSSLLIAFSEVALGGDLELYLAISFAALLAGRRFVPGLLFLLVFTTASLSSFGLGALGNAVPFALFGDLPLMRVVLTRIKASASVTGVT